MPDTSLGITYPASTDHARVWEHFQALAQDVDTLLGRKGYVGESTRSTASSSFTTTETVIQSVTFTAVAGVRYKIMAVQSVQSTVAADLIQARLRWSAGSSLSTAGTEITTLLINQDVAGKGIIVTLLATVTGLSGEVTVGVTAVRAAGTGTCSSFGNSQQENIVLVEGI